MDTRVDGLKEALGEVRNCVAALIEAMGMAALNSQREHLGQSMAYGDDDFFGLFEKYQLYQPKDKVTTDYNGDKQ